MARIRGLLRWPAAAGTENETPVFDDGRLHIDLARRAVHRDGEKLALSRKEYALLALLIRHLGRVVTQPQLLREPWGRRISTTRITSGSWSASFGRSSVTTPPLRATSPPNPVSACGFSPPRRLDTASRLPSEADMPATLRFLLEFPSPYNWRHAPFPPPERCPHDGLDGSALPDLPSHPRAACVALYRDADRGRGGTW